jgi:carbamoyl-phosphate synthase small subunit
VAVVVRDHCRRHFYQRAERSLDEFLRREGVPGLSDVDTRALTVRLRDAGICRAAVGDAEPSSLVEKARALPPMSATNWVERVTTPSPREFAAAAPPAEGGPPYRVAVLDFGVKRSIIARLAAEGCAGWILPARTRAAEILAGDHEGVFLSNGPGDPAALPELTATVKDLLAGDLPIFGICLGHQLIAQALGAKTARLPFGHHGANHPVRHLASGRVEITSQNHNYSVLADSLPASVARITHLSLNDRTVEGLELVGRPVYSVQFHPEAAPGPRDSAHLFERFRAEMAARRAAGKPTSRRALARGAGRQP